MEHEKLQKYIRRLFNLEEDTPIADVVAELVDREEYAYATEALFGCNRDDDTPLSDNQIQWMHYLYLWTGGYPEMLKEMARQHRWQTQRANRGYSFEVFPGEWLVIPEPYATQMLKTFFEG